MAISIDARKSESAVLASLDVIPEERGKAAPYSVAGRSVIPLNLKSKCHEEDKIAEKCQALWEKAAKWIREQEKHASEISLKVLPDPNAPERDIVVTISYKDEKGNIKVKGTLSEELIKESEKLLNLIQKERSHHTTPPLELSIPKNEFLPTTLDEFTKKSLPTLEASLPEPARKNIARNLLATDTFINTLQQKLALNPAFKNLKEELDHIDRNAVFIAVAAWNRFHTGDLDKDKRSEIYEAVQIAHLAAIETLKRNTDAHKKAHWFRNALRLLPKPTDSEAHIYGHDVGALLIQETWEYQQHCENAGIKDKKASIEHLVVQLMMRLEEDREIDHPLLKGLDLSEPIRAAKEEARKVCASAERSLEEDLEI